MFTQACLERLITWLQRRNTQKFKPKKWEEHGDALKVNLCVLAKKKALALDTLCFDGNPPTSVVFLF
jgi:hypothetical protein|tara:strand:+ start:1767 stop:1967 length:201 start_codon:yes stop_codon:yes gene_type:complete